MLTNNVRIKVFFLIYSICQNKLIELYTIALGLPFSQNNIYFVDYTDYLTEDCTSIVTYFSVFLYDFLILM